MIYKAALGDHVNVLKELISDHVDVTGLVNLVSLRIAVPM